MCQCVCRYIYIVIVYKINPYFILQEAKFKTINNDVRAIEVSKANVVRLLVRMIADSNLRRPFKNRLSIGDAEYHRRV